MRQCAFVIVVVQVQYHGFFVSIELGEVPTQPIYNGPLLTDGISIGSFNFDNFGAQVRKKLGTERTCEDPSKIDNP